MVVKWDRVHNLVGPHEQGRLWRRHILDGLQVLRAALAAKGAEQRVKWVDIGTGAGVPGLICALAMADNPNWQFILIEPLQKRAAFLREVIREAGATADVVVARAGDVGTGSLSADIVSARAVASLETLLGWSVPLLARGIAGENSALCLFLKGETLAAELTAARECWRFTSTLHPSLSAGAGGAGSGTGSALLELRQVEPQSGR